jgi:hypothetical protein
MSNTLNKKAIFNADGNLIFLTDVDGLEKWILKDDQTVVDVDDDFQIEGFITTYANGEISQVEEDLAPLIAESAAVKYRNDRALQYPPIGDQLDALFKAGAFPEDMAAQIQAVKDAYPKP